MKLKKKLFFLLLSLFSLTTLASQIPQSWKADFIEDEGSIPKNFNTETEEESQKLTETYTNYLDDTEQSLTVLQENPEPKEKGRGHLKVTEVMTLLGVSTSGTVGLLGLSGQGVTQLYWGPKKYGAPKNMQKKRKKNTLVVKKGTTLAELEAHAEAIANHLSKRKKFANRILLQENITKSLVKFSTTMSKVEISPYRQWNLSAVQANFGVDLAGNIHSVGISSGISFTLEWPLEVIPMAILPPDTEIADQPEKKSANLSTLIETLSADLDYSSQLAHSISGFKPIAFEIGVGISAGGAIGLVSASEGLGLVLIFTPSEVLPKSNIEEMKSLLTGVEPPLDGSIPFWSVDKQTANKGLLSWLRKKSKARLKIMSRRKFRRGLSRTFRVAKFFANKAHQRELSRKRRGVSSIWGLKRIKNIFELSLNGGIGVATVSGIAAIEIELENENF